MAVSQVRIGDLRHRITFQTQVRTADGMGGFTLSWQDVDTVWAYVRPVSSKERLFAQRIEYQRSHEVIIRYKTGIDNSMRFVFEGRVFQIKGDLKPDERKFFLKIDAEENQAT
jgi:SPP1 family predicted phage head-tail adaptor